MKKIKSWWFLRKLNKAIKQYNAKVTIVKETETSDLLNIQIGKEFTHQYMNPTNYNDMFLNHIIKEIEMKVIKINHDRGELIG